MITVERVQTGVRMERRLLKVLKGLAEYLDLSLGDLLEGLVLHAFEGRVVPFDATTLDVIRRLREVYGLDLTAADSHRLTSADDPPEGAGAAEGEGHGGHGDGHADSENRHRNAGERHGDL